MAYRRGSGAVSPGAAQPLPQGGAKQVNDLVESIAPEEDIAAALEEDDEGDVEVELEQASARPTDQGRGPGRPSSGAAAQPQGRNFPGLPQEFEDFISKPTARPDEPITAGMPFGPGSSQPSAIRPSTDEDVRKEIARKLLQSSDATPRVKAFAARILRRE